MQGTKFVVYTDGGCQVNPGGAGGLGVVILNSETGQRQEISEGYVSSTNNRMEILAVVRGLSQLPRGAEVDLYSDSEYVLKTAMGEYREKKNRDRRWIDETRRDRAAFTAAAGHAGSDRRI